MKLRNLAILGLLIGAVQMASAMSLWLDGAEQSAPSPGGSGGGDVSTTNNNTYTGNNTFSNGLITTQVALTDPASLGTVFSNQLSSAVAASSGFYTDANQLVWFNSTNSTYTVKQSGSQAGQFGWTNASTYQYGEYFARVRCVTSRGTAQAVGIRIVSTSGNPLNQVVSSNNPVGQILSCGYTGANVRGVELLLSSTPATWSLDFNDLYLTNVTLPDIASGTLTLRGTTKIELDSGSVLPRYSNATALGSADLPFASLNARTGTVETLNVSSNTIRIGEGTNSVTLSSENGGKLNIGGSLGVNPSGSSVGASVDGNIAATNGSVSASASMLIGTNVITISGGALYVNNGVIGGAGPSSPYVDVGGSITPTSGTCTINASASASHIGGGAANDIGASATHGFIGGGNNNDISASATYSTIGGGSGNNVGVDGGSYSFVGGGNGNQARLSYDAVVGGFQNYLSCDYGFIGGGYQNTLRDTSHSCVLAGGYINKIQTGCDQATISGGNQNIITNNADHSVIPGGSLNQIVNAKEAFAMGRRAYALHDHTFVWSSDADATPFSSTASNQVLFKAANGIKIASFGGGQDTNTWTVAGMKIVTNANVFIYTPAWQGSQLLDVGSNRIYYAVGLTTNDWKGTNLN